MANVNVRTATYNKDGRIERIDLVGIDEEVFQNECKKLEPYLIALEQTFTTTYDDSDDERVTPSTTYTKRCKYREINPKDNSEYMLMENGEIIGVVFIVRNGRHKRAHVFSFDGRIAQSMRLGYSASHSSQFEYVDSVSLVKRGENRVPMTAKEVDFEQSEMFPSL